MHVDKWVRGITAAVAVAAMSVAAMGCHTVKGAGKDIESAGKTVQKTAEKSK